MLYMKKWNVKHITFQVLLTNKLDHYKGKGRRAINQHIQT